MSTQRRKIAYHNIVFTDGENRTFDNRLFSDFIDFLSKLPDDEKIFRDEKNKKAVSIDSIQFMDKEGMNFLKIVFKSCKYNHFPDYMSSIDGSERPTDKRIDEGDKELTHMMMHIRANEAYTIFEERRNGVTIGGVIKYFNKILADCFYKKGINSNEYLWAGNVPPEDFLTSLDKTTRLSSADIFITKEVLGSAGFNLLGNNEFDCREELILTMKSRKKDTLSKRAIRGLYTKLGASETKITKIRIYGKDIDNMNVMLDSTNTKKKTEIVVDLRSNGTVDSYSIFAKMEELFGVTE